LEPAKLQKSGEPSWIYASHQFEKQQTIYN